MAASVADLSPTIAALAPEWRVLEPLMGGTRAMRLAAEKLLPRWPNEDDGSYTHRLNTATLFPAFRRTISVMVGKPFAKPVTIGDDVPAQLKDWCANVDMEGVNLHAFAAEMFGEALCYALAGILVDAPRPLATASPVPTVADQKAAGVRPYFVRVKHRQILGYRVDVVNGVRTLGQLRIMECVTEADGLFGTSQIDQVRVLEPGKWSTYRKVASVKPEDEWQLFEQGTSGLPYIPFVPLYGWRTGFMEAIPPLLDLAYLNVKHWQSQSDQDTILHVARVPILAVSGVSGDFTLTVGGSAAVQLPEGGQMKFVEHTGAAIDAGASSLDALEQQMIQAGAELLVKQPGTRTATESENDAEANKSDLQRIAEGFENSLDQALQMMADYGQLGPAGHVTLYKDFGAATLSDASAQLILSMEGAGLISGATAINEFKRRGTLSSEVDPAKEAAAVEAQGPKLGLLVPPAEPPEPPAPGPAA